VQLQHKETLVGLNSMVKAHFKETGNDEMRLLGTRFPISKSGDAEAAGSLKAQAAEGTTERRCGDQKNPAPAVRHKQTPKEFRSRVFRARLLIQLSMPLTSS